MTVQVTSGTKSGSANANVNVVRGGPPSPSANYTLTGATQNQFNGSWEVEAGRSITLTASEPDAGATFAWTPSATTTPAGPFSGRTVQFAFNSPGSRTVNLAVTGGGTTTTGVTSTTIRITVTPPRFQALMIPGAGHIDPVPPATDGTWATDISIANPGTTAMNLTLDFEPFGTEFPSDLSQIAFNSDRTGMMQVWRMRTDGGQQEQVTNDEFNNWFPHPSPDGKWLAFLSYEKDVKGFVDLAFADIPRIPIFQPYSNVAMQKNVSGYQYWFHRRLDYRALVKA